MKNLIVLIFLTAYSFNSLVAQVDDRAAFQIGIKAGANFANVYDAEGEDFNADGKFGFVAGGFISIPLGSSFGLHVAFPKNRTIEKFINFVKQLSNEEEKIHRRTDRKSAQRAGIWSRDPGSLQRAWC